MRDVPLRHPGRAQGLQGMCLRVANKSSAFASQLRLLISFLSAYIDGDGMSPQRGARRRCPQQLCSWKGSDGCISPTSQCCLWSGLCHSSSVWEDGLSQWSSHPSLSPHPSLPAASGFPLCRSKGG